MYQTGEKAMDMATAARDVTAVKPLVEATGGSWQRQTSVHGEEN
jgi:hypothetical protein